LIVTNNTLIARNNYFSKGDPGGELRHAGNRYDGIALRKRTGWRTIDSLDDVDWEDLASIVGSPPVASVDVPP
jgi:hypothetical protein